MAQVQIGAHSFEAFVSVEDADKHLSADVSRATLWALRPVEARARGIVSATRKLLELPMCATPDFGDVPQVLQEVAAELACDLVSKPKLFSDASGSSNVKSAKAGSAQVEFFAPVTGGPPIPKGMWNRLIAAGVVCLGEESDLMAGAFVSGISDGCDTRPWKGRYADDLPRDDCEGLI